MTPDFGKLYPKLSTRAIHYLSGKDGKVDAFRTAVSVAYTFKNVGYDYDDFFQAVSLSELAYGICSDDDSRTRLHRLDSRLTKVWDLMENWHSEADYSDVVSDMYKLRQDMAARTWQGRSASSDRAVMLALIDWAYELGCDAVDANVRDLGVRAGVPHKTASRCLRRLADMDYIRKGPRPERGKAQQWKIIVRSKYNNDTYKPNPPISKSYVSLIDIANHDVFVRSGLGVVAGRLYTTVPFDVPVTAKSVSDTTGMSVQTARNNLKRLVSVGLATTQGARPVEYTLVHKDSQQLDTIAATLGVSGLRQVQADLVAVDRELFAEVEYVKQRQQRRKDWEAERARVFTLQSTPPLPKRTVRRFNRTVSQGHALSPRQVWSAIRQAKVKPVGVPHCGLRRRLEEQYI